MKKVIYALFLPLVVVSGLVFANRETKNEPARKSTPKPVCVAESEAERKNWEATPAGLAYLGWTASPEGKQVLSDAAKIRKHIVDSTSMEAVITSLTLPPGSRLGFGVMARIEGADYIVKFDTEKSQLEQLQSLKVNDKIVLRGHVVSHAPKYAYAIVSGESVVRDGKKIYKRIPPKNGC